MPITVKHTKVSAIPDDGDTSLVRPSDWNADHTLVGLGTMAEQNANAVNITGGTITGVSGLGDVTGPASATDNAVARFDSTTGKVIQNSTVTINDNGTLEAVNGISFDTTPTSAPTAEGSLSWNSSDGTLDLVMKGGNVVQQIGEEQYYTVRNQTGSTIANGTPVMANGVTAGSGRLTVTPAIANGSIDELRFIGLTTESITNGINGYVTSFGYVRGLDTRGTPYGETWAEGDVIYVSPTTAGYLTNVEPTAPNLKIVVAIVITRNQTSGVLLVRPTAYPHITHLSDVNISSPTSGNTLIYDAVQGRWENASITGGTGLSVTNGAGTIALANTGVTSAVAGTGISVSGATGAVTVAIDSTVATLTGTQTLTNKTLTDPTINGNVTTTGLNFDSNTLVIDATNNRVGINNASPAQTVDIQSASGGTTARLRNTTGNFIDFIETSGSSRTGYIGTTNGTNFVIHNDKAGQMQFDTNNLERMRIDASGNVGIGTSSPTAGYKLDINGNLKLGGSIDEKVFDVTGTTPALSPTNGTIQTWTLTGNSTPTQGTWTEGESMTLMINDGTAYTVTWTSLGVVWVGGTAPTLATTGSTVIELWEVGTTIYGALVGTVA
jgi:hypothetical protein